MEPGPWGALPVLALASGGFGALTRRDYLQSPLLWVSETTSSEDFSLHGGWNWDRWTSLRDLVSFLNFLKVICTPNVGA